MKAEIWALILSPVTTLGGVVLGWFLGGKTARRAASDERRWAEGQAVRERQEAAAARLDEGMIEVMGVMPQMATERPGGAGAPRRGAPAAARGVVAGHGHRGWGH